ncbi:MAG: type II secretion system F family protein [Deltaproteobacteria bacterium]
MTFTIEQLTALNDEIASLVRGGVPLEPGLRALGKDSGGALAEISRALSARMTSGASLAEALRAEEGRLPAAYRTVVEAGLRAGRLPAALEATSNFARELVELRRKISLALLYPLIVVGLAYFLFLVFIVDLVERFRETYEVFRIPVHWPLAIVVSFAESARHWWWAPPLAMIVAVVWWMATGGAHILSFSGPARPLAWIPGVAAISRRFQLAGFADLLALLIEHGVPLPEGLRLTGDATGDSRLRHAARELALAVEQGQAAPASPAERFGFPPFLFWVLTCGQQRGGLARLLRHAGTMYRRRAVSLANWFKLVFPIVTALVIGGGVTALYALTLFGPLAQFWRDLGLD